MFSKCHKYFFFYCPPLAHFLPCQFHEPVSLPTACYGPACELLTPLLLGCPSQGCKISTAFCLPPSCWASLSSVPSPRLHDQASHYFCQDVVFPPLFRHSGDLALHLFPGWRSMDRLISSTGGAVGKAPAEGSTERCSSAWCCILGPGRQSSWPCPWVTSEQKVW